MAKVPRAGAVAAMLKYRSMGGKYVSKLNGSPVSATRAYCSR